MVGVSPLFPGIPWPTGPNAVPLAMQKVEGSSPFSRSLESPANRRVFCRPETLSWPRLGIGHQNWASNGCSVRVGLGPSPANARGTRPAHDRRPDTPVTSVRASGSPTRPARPGTPRPTKDSEPERLLEHPGRALARLTGDPGRASDLRTPPVSQVLVLPPSGVRVVGSERHGHRLKTATPGRKDGLGQPDLVMRSGSG